ncbi:hypothetical protein N8315_09195 [Octadecabacter sp.]|nr:hypothetical protein [Octadecabacter sp.]MDC1397617.1 hypothetical protein [Octadecabacter sp.]
MISSLGFTFVVIPCIGATAMAALLWDWRLVAAAAFGALGVIALGPMLPEAARLITLPALMGVVIGASALAPRLWMRPTSDIWSRMLWALVPTFALTFLFLITNSSGA